MSATGTLVTEQHFEYLTAHTTPEDRLLGELKAAARKAGIPAIWISPAQASLMQILLRAAGARTVVEVGTLAGYSAIAMARALPRDGHVHTIEIDGAHADFAERWIARSDVAGRVTVHRGPGAEVLPRLPVPTGGADAAFLDADKVGYPVYLEHALRLVRPGGLVLVDNAFAFGQLFDEAPSDREVGAVRAFNETMAAETRLQSVIVPIGDGLWVGVRRPA
jgi:predicted O-methyltransferase YrrM